MQTAITVLALSLLGHDDFTVREWADRAARLYPPHHATIDAMLSQCESPEAVWRLRKLRPAAVARECDRLAAHYGGYPKADWTLGWPVDPDAYWEDWPSADWPREFYQPRMIEREAEWGCYQEWPDDDAYRHRTRAALIQFACRTGNWPAVRFYLGGRTWKTLTERP